MFFVFPQLSIKPSPPLRRGFNKKFHHCGKASDCGATNPAVFLSRALSSTKPVGGDLRTVSGGSTTPDREMRIMSGFSEMSQYSGLAGDRVHGRCGVVTGN